MSYLNIENKKLKSGDGANIFESLAKKQNVHTKHRVD